MQRPGKGIRYCRTGDTGDCEPCDMGAGSQTLVLWKTSKHFVLFALSCLFVCLFWGDRVSLGGSDCSGTPYVD